MCFNINSQKPKKLIDYLGAEATVVGKKRCFAPSLLELRFQWREAENEGELCVRSPSDECYGEE